MLTVAKIAVRATFGAAVLGAAAACGSAGIGSPYGGELGDDFGFVGSGPGGFGYGRDGGTDGGASERQDAGVEGGAPRGDAGGFEGGALPDSGHTSGDDGGNSHGVVDGGSSVGVTFTVPPGFFTSLDWVISGPSGYYSGTVYFGDAQSIEFVAGGIQAGSGYTMTMAGTDRDGDPCSGTSAPFAVLAGQVAGASLVLTCDAPGPDASETADVTTGSVGVEAGLVFGDH